jgi:hypothetical protein
MKKQIWLLALASAVLLSAAPAWAQEFYVIAGGGVGTRITSLPYTISSPGFYYLTGNLTYTVTSTGILVNSDDVTLDLMGFRLTGSGSSAGIDINGHNNVEVRNGSLNSWGSCLIDISGGIGNRALNLRAENCTSGIFLLGGGGYLVKGCSVEASDTGIICGGASSVIGNTVTNCAKGIYGSGTISGNSVINSSLYGIQCIGASTVIGNTVVTTGVFNPAGIYITTAAACLVTQNTVSGPGYHLSDPNGVAVNVANTNAGF